MYSCRATHYVIRKYGIASLKTASKCCMPISTMPTWKCTQRAEIGYRRLHSSVPSSLIQHRPKFQQIRFNSTSPYNSQHPDYPGPGPSVSSSENGKLRLEYLMLQLEERPQLKENVYDFMELLLDLLEVNFRLMDQSPLASKLPKGAQRVIILLRLMWNAEINARWRDLVRTMDQDRLPVYLSDLCLVGDYVLGLLD